MDARHLAALLVIVATMLAGCADGDGGADGGGEAPAIDQEVLDLHADCREKRENANLSEGRPVCNPENPVAVMNTSMGEIRLELYVDVAPVTAGNFVNLTEDGFYDGTRIHRVVEGFVIQDGDPLTKDKSKEDQWGSGGPGYTIRDEFACRDGTIQYEHPGSRKQPADQCDGSGGFLATHDSAGVLSMANRGRPETGSSQYFVTLSATESLDGYHAVFGQVIAGMETVQKIGQVETDEDDQPVEDVVIRDVAIEG